MSDGNDPNAFGGLLKILMGKVAAPKSAKTKSVDSGSAEQSNNSIENDPNAGNPCCDDLGMVHIAYRGVSDDKMYIVYNKQWRETRFFRSNGLRVFCAKCRQRLV